MHDLTHRLIAPCVALLAACALVLAQDRGPESSSAAPGIRVLSANVRYGSARDGDHAWEKRAEFMVATIRDARPDILGLQEALEFQVDAVRAVFPHHVVIGEGRDGGDKGEWTALLVDARRFTVRATGTFRLAPVDRLGEVGWDAALTRIATWVEIADRENGGRALRVVNAHFDHRGKQARLESARLIAGWVAARPSMPTVVMGDLNAGEESAPLDALRGAGYRDAFRVVHPDAAEVGTFHGFKGVRTGRKIDHVLVDGGIEVIDAWIDWTEDGERYPSDHRFVGATLRPR